MPLNANTQAAHGAVSVDLILQSLVLHAVANLSFYRLLPKTFIDRPVRPGQTIGLKVTKGRTAKRKAFGDAYTFGTGELDDIEIELQTEIYDAMEIPGIDLASSMIDLEDAYSFPMGEAIATDIVAHGMEALAADTPVANLTANFNPSNFGHDDLVDQEKVMRIAKIRGDKFCVLSPEYAAPLKEEIGFTRTLPEGVGGDRVYTISELPNVITGMRVFETNAISEEMFFGNNLSLGCVAGVPFRPADGDFTGTITDAIEPHTGLTIQGKKWWEHNPGKYKIVPSLYLGHKVLQPYTVYHKKAAA